jgi:Ser/Thr protein kinase RdoA (MazF antagonist)
VVTAAGSNWRYGATREKQEKLQSLLEALQELRDGGLTVAGVVAAIHRWRVLPLAERRLPLLEMMSGVDLEGSQMSSVSLSADDLRRRVAGTVGRLDAGALTQPLMRPECGCMSLVSVRSFSFLVSGCP